ncbi:MAG: hypothetical protein VKL97_04075 [Cyanobacteriota bacterium]|nr:hypothetical protein [Cyanobacteriota bacterium]
MEVPMDGTTTNPEPTCLTRTCLKWNPDGELTPVDLQLVLERLAAVDPAGAVLSPRGDQHRLASAA